MLIVELRNIQIIFFIFRSDTENEWKAIKKECAESGAAEVVICSHWSDGGAGATDLAEAVINASNSTENDFRWTLFIENIFRKSCKTGFWILIFIVFNIFRFLYDTDQTFLTKIKTIAREMYGAVDISVPPEVVEKFQRYEQKV